MTTDWDNVTFDAHGRLVDVTQRAEPGPPPDLTWTPVELYALTVPKVFGRIVAVSDHRGIEYNLVAAGEIFTDDTGVWIWLVTNECFREWGKIPADRRPHTPTPARAVAAKHVWVMDDIASRSAT